MDGLQLENRTQVILWLRENYKHATTTSVSKRSVFAHYLDACKKQNVLTPISHTYFGKLVRKAFPDVRCNRKGPRGSAQQHYRLIRADGGDADEFLSALGDEHDDVHVDDDEEDEFAAKSASKRKAGSKKAAATTAAALRKNGVSRPSSRARAAATAAASTISRMINADQAPANLTEAWSFSSAPSSPSFSFGAQQGQQHHGAESIPSSPGAQSSSEYEQEELHQHQQLIEDVIEEEVLEEGHEEVFQQQHQNEEDLDEDDYEEDNEEEHVEEEQAEEEDEQDEEEDEQAEEEEVEEFNFDLPQFEITPGEESPGTSFSYEACPPLSGHDQNLRLQQQLLSSSSASSVQQSCFEPSAFYDFVSPDLEMPLSAINQVANLAEDFGWSMPSMPSAVNRCHMAAAAAYGSQPAMMQQQQRYAYQQQQPQQVLQQQQQQSSGVLSFLLSEQVPATQCSDLAEWVAHYCI